MAYALLHPRRVEAMSAPSTVASGTCICTYMDNGMDKDRDRDQHRDKDRDMDPLYSREKR